MNVNAIKFRKKPVVIEAYQWKESDALNLRGKGWPQWLVDATRSNEGEDQIVSQSFDGYATIKTLEGEMRADIGDWIIRGINGELYPCKPDIFAATYEPADATTSTGPVVGDVSYLYPCKGGEGIAIVEGALPHQVRVIEEYNQLYKRHIDLTKFFDTDEYRSLSVEERNRLKEQSLFMTEYQRVLLERIRAF